MPQHSRNRIAASTAGDHEIKQGIALELPWNCSPLRLGQTSVLNSGSWPSRFSTCKEPVLCN
jgi:hypothetical protein